MNKTESWVEKEKESLHKIQEVQKIAERDKRNRALMVIETLCGGDIVTGDIEKLKEDIYKIAHSAIEPKTCEHEDWVNKTEKLFEAFKKGGLL